MGIMGVLRTAPISVAFTFIPLLVAMAIIGPLFHLIIGRGLLESLLLATICSGTSTPRHVYIIKDLSYQEG